MAKPYSNKREVQVFYRIRPLNETEQNNPSQLREDTYTIAGKVYVFDKVIKPNTTVELASYDLAQDLLSGYNGSVLTYGQTSSDLGWTRARTHPELHGIIPEIAQDVFTQIYSMDENSEFTIKVSFYEMYNEKIRDLLDVTKKNLSIHEDKDGEPYVKGAAERLVATPQEMMDCFEEGMNNRKVVASSMPSERSHSIFLLHVAHSHLFTRKQTVGKVYLVDLAGVVSAPTMGAEGAVPEEN